MIRKRRVEARIDDNFRAGACYRLCSIIAFSCSSQFLGHRSCLIILPFRGLLLALAVRNVDFFVLNMRTRMPFRYGIASLVALPHLFVRLEAEVDGAGQVGLASEGLPPKRRSA